MCCKVVLYPCLCHAVQVPGPCECSTHSGWSGPARPTPLHSEWQQQQAHQHLQHCYCYCCMVAGTVTLWTMCQLHTACGPMCSDVELLLGWWKVWHDAALLATFDQPVDHAKAMGLASCSQSRAAAWRPYTHCRSERYGISLFEVSAAVTPRPTCETLFCSSCLSSAAQIFPHGSTDALPFATMGSGSLNAMAVFEAGYKDDMTREEAIDLATRAIRRYCL